MKKKITPKAEVKEKIGLETLTSNMRRILIEHINFLKKNGGNYEHLEQILSKGKVDGDVLRFLQSIIYRNLRAKADYPFYSGNEVINNALNINKGKIDIKKQGGWIYRGDFSRTTERGSLNVNLEENLIRKLDDLIISGEFKGNYKIPDDPIKVGERHDTITLYFQEKPTPELLQKISEISRPYVRGDNLIGKKINDGFFMSEIGSIKTRDILGLIESLEGINENLAYLVRETAGSSNKLSEAQFYSLKEIFREYGLDLNYKRPLDDTSNGFRISSL